jgi:hypothetical protein
MLCCCNRIVADDEEGPAVACWASVATWGSEAEGGSANVVEVEVDIVGGAATPVFGVVGDVPRGPVLIGARFGETLEGPAALAPSILFMLPAESLAECR